MAADETERAASPSTCRPSRVIPLGVLVVFMMVVPHMVLGPAFLLSGHDDTMHAEVCRSFATVLPDAPDLPLGAPRKSCP